MSMRVAWVTGASRGIGRGVATALGAAGWTVWVSARSAAGTTTSHLPGTVEEAAAAVSEAGGLGIPVVCDHRDDDRVRAVVDQIAARDGRLDLLVNNVWAGYERLNAGAWQEWNAPFWDQPIGLWDAMMTGGVRAHYVATALCAGLLRAAEAGVVVTVSMEAGRAHRDDFGVAYSMAKAADDRFALAAAGQLRQFGVASVSLHPGLVRTEGVMQFAEHFDLSASQSPEGVGRVVAALATDPDVLALTGRALTVDWLADRYGVDPTD
jgi:NAD(P)-dependent dehydrogenase (short-subunit alcohol dehydrogenase family)